jgi:hypothetical protein
MTTLKALRQLERKALTDDRLSADEAKELVDLASAPESNQADARAYLGDLLHRKRSYFEPEAQAQVNLFLGLEPRVPVSSEVARIVTGSRPDSFRDDSVFFGPDGKLSGESGIKPYVRSYNPRYQGPLRERHGSEAPAAKTLSPEQLAAKRSLSPGKALDQAARVFGVSLATDVPNPFGEKVQGFEELAHSKEFFDPKAPFWWGTCDAWSWSSLSQWVNERVDVEGPEGQRGVWIGGEWMSRADLGNWLMATAFSLSIRERGVAVDNDPTAESLVKTAMQFMVNDGGGLIADVWRDSRHNGKVEVWNQPFVGAEMETETLSGKVVDDILAKAKEDEVTGGTTVKLVKLTGKFAKEIGLSHEGQPKIVNSPWNVYVVTDANGKMVKAYMADDARLNDVNVPVRTSEELPEYLWKPSLDTLFDAIGGETNPTIESDPRGQLFKFFVGTVLAKGVPGATRTAFEEKALALTATATATVDAEALATLRRDFPNVANAYSPEQWEQAFGSRGLTAKDFGAAWATEASIPPPA